MTASPLPSPALCLQQQTPPALDRIPIPIFEESSAAQIFREREAARMSRCEWTMGAGYLSETVGVEGEGIDVRSVSCVVTGLQHVLIW